MTATHTLRWQNAGTGGFSPGHLGSRSERKWRPAGHALERHEVAACSAPGATPLASVKAAHTFVVEDAPTLKKPGKNICGVVSVHIGVEASARSGNTTSRRGQSNHKANRHKRNTRIRNRRPTLLGSPPTVTTGTDLSALWHRPPARVAATHGLRGERQQPPCVNAVAAPVRGSRAEPRERGPGIPAGRSAQRSPNTVPSG